MEASAAEQIARTQAAREQLAKEWILRIVEETPLEEVERLPVALISSEAPALIGEIIGALSDPGIAGSVLPADPERARRLAAIRTGAEAPRMIPRDLAALQTLMIESLRREIPERNRGDFAAVVSRLAALFGTIQGTINASLVEARSGGAAVDELTGLPGPVQFEEWMRLLFAEQRRYGHGFALAIIDIDGLAKINEAYGRAAGDRMVAAIAGVISHQVRACDRAFRLGEDEFSVIAPHCKAPDLVPMATRIAELIADAQLPEGPRIAITAGVAACPADGLSAESLLARAEESTYAAKASGRPIEAPPSDTGG